MKVRADGHGLQAQIKALYDYRELIEQIFNERELFVPAGETDTIARLEHLSRTRMVRLYAHSDGRSARLSTDMLAFCRLASRRQRLERIGIDVNEAFDAADTELAKWKVAARQGDDELAAELQDRIEEIIDDVEHAFDEQIVNIRERPLARSRISATTLDGSTNCTKAPTPSPSNCPPTTTTRSRS
jgi:hypothetical protein